MTPRDRALLAVLLGGGMYVWIVYPAVMAALLLGFLVFSMITLSVLAMLRRDRRRLTETRATRALRLVNEQEPRFHWWSH